MKRTGIYVLVAILLLRSATTAATDLESIVESNQWDAHFSGGVLSASPVAKAAGEQPGLQIVGKTTPEKRNYASITHRFEQPVNMSGPQCHRVLCQSGRACQTEAHA
ncbi:MAG: hypothetical protein KAI66_23320 [Lentisphaeria bacterium]|nr:hypothetical protein [Lentisphaeria bacterium]